jgi:hypothetical protein
VNLRLSASILLLAACSSSSRPPASGDTPGADAGGADAALSDGGASNQDHSPGTFCAGRAEAFCDDFDTPAFTSKSWSINDTMGASGTGLPPGGLDTTVFKSAPSAFSAKMPMIAGATTELLQIQGGFSGPDASHVDADFAFEVHIGALGASGRIEVARIEGVNPITFQSYGVALLVSASGASVELTQGSGGSVTHPLVTAPKAGTWSRVAFHLGLERTVTGPPTSFTVTVDGASPETFSLERGMGVHPYVRLGLSVAGPSAPCQVTFDDVTYDAH